MKHMLIARDTQAEEKIHQILSSVANASNDITFAQDVMVFTITSKKMQLVTRIIDLLKELNLIVGWPSL